MRTLIAFGLLTSLCGVAVAQPPPDAPPSAPEPAPSQPPPTPEPPVVVQPAPAPAPVPAPAPPPEPEEPTHEEQLALANYAPSSVRLGGFLQSQYRARQDSPAQLDNDGFRMARIRFVGLGETRAGNLELSAFVEAELQPSFDLNDGFVTVSRRLPKNARITLDGGQMRVPISRQNLLSDTRIAFVDKAQIATIAPNRDLGAKVTVDLPRPEAKRRRRGKDGLRVPGVRLIGGVFNGEGTNQVENINQRYFWTGRVEVTAIGEERELAESAFGGRFLTLAGSIGTNKRSEGDRLDHVTYYGVDVSGAYRGVSGSFEYLEVRHSQTTANEDMDDPTSLDFKANGFTAQLNYLLPFRVPPLRQGRVELGFRLEEIDRNDTISIPQLGDPNQSVRAITAVISYYLRMHTLKAQLAFTSFKELEDRTATNENAAYDNDQVLLQVTYRLE